MAETVDLISHLQGDRYRVSCSAHGGRGDLDKTVDTIEHATNLEAKHLREHHAGAVSARGSLPGGHVPSSRPASVPANLSGIALDLSGPATLAAMAYSLPSSNELASGFIAMWEALVGETGEAAEKVAKQVQAQRSSVTAAVVPF